MSVPVAADRELVERVLRESGVERAVPEPAFVEYIQTLAEAFLRWLGPRLRPVASGLDSPGFAILLWSVVAAAAVAALLLLLGRSRRPRPSPPAAPTPLVAKVPVAESDHEAWRVELEARLRRGDAAGALEALWWWVARSLLGPRAEASWTSREVLVRAGRPDLRPLANGLDRMAYGLPPPSVVEVRHLVTRFQKALA